MRSGDERGGVTVSSGPASRPACNGDAAAWMDDLAERVLPGILDSLAAESGDEPEPGERIGSYRLLSVLGRGGLGVVFGARDERLNRAVALKFLSRPAWARQETRERLLEEARAAARLDHPGIAVVHDVGETEDGRAFIVMAHSDGETLAARIARGRAPIEEAVDVGRQVADALAAAHRAGIIHRDVKPSNIIVTERGRVKVVDFGIAGRAGTQGSVAGSLAGTIPYMSPEQASGDAVDARSDVWSLGVVLYELLTGVRPFRGERREDVLDAIRHAQPEPLASVRPEASPELSGIVARCLAKHAKDRFQSADELLAALIELAPEWPGRDRPIGSSETRDDATVRYRRGRHFMDGGDPASASKARDEFLAALNVDPTFARAWSGLSDAYELLGYLAVLPPEEAHVRARAAAERALELDPDLAEAHVSLATVLLDYYRDWAGAERHYLRALALDPSYATGRQLYAEFLRDQGRSDEALAEIDEAIRLDPLSPYNRLVRSVVFRMARRYEEAVEELQRLLDATPDYRMAYLYLGLTYAAAGEHEGALAALDRVDPDRTFPDAICVRGVALAGSGQRENAEEALRQLDRLNSGHHVLPFHSGLIHLALGDVERALTLLEEDADRRSWFSRILRVEPLVDSARGHPRFHALLAQVRNDGSKPTENRETGRPEVNLR